MPPHEPRDPASIHDMLDSARAAVAMTAGVSFHDFASNRQLYRAIEREVEIVGEAARRVSDVLKQAVPAIPWSRIVGTRNRLAHEYDQIKLAILYRIARVHLPELIFQLEELIAQLPPPPPVKE